MLKILGVITLQYFIFLANAYINPRFLDQLSDPPIGGSPFYDFFHGYFGNWLWLSEFDGQIFNGLYRYGWFCSFDIGMAGHMKKPKPVDYIDELCYQAEMSLQCIFHDVAKYEDDDEAWLKIRHFNREAIQDYLDDGLSMDYIVENIDIYGDYFGNFKGTSGYPASQLQHYPSHWQRRRSAWDYYPWYYDRETAVSSGFPSMFYVENDKTYFNDTYEGYTSEQDRQTSIIARCEDAFGVSDPEKSNYNSELCIVFEYFVSKIREFIYNGGSMNDLNSEYYDIDSYGGTGECWKDYQSRGSNSDPDPDALLPRDMEWIDLEPKCAGRYPSRKSYGTPFANDFVEKEMCGYKSYDPLLYVCCDPTTEQLEHSQENCGPVNCDNCVHNCWEACGWEYPVLKVNSGSNSSSSLGNV